MVNCSGQSEDDILQVMFLKRNRHSIFCPGFAGFDCEYLGYIHTAGKTSLIFLSCTVEFMVLIFLVTFIRLKLQFTSLFNR